MFQKIFKKYNIDLDSYKINNGEEIKKEIETYIIKLEDTTELNKIYIGAHHIDFHSSFPSGLIITHPEFSPIIEELYKGRKTHVEYKYILNSTIGYMQSLDCCKASWAHLSRDAINNNNKRVRELAEAIKNFGGKILSYNTDGIWYQGDIYDGPGKGPNLCEWSHDHIDCMIRFKSKGSYEFIEDGNYTPVVRGRTLLDDIKTREDWVWGDIYQEEAKVKKIILNKDNTLSVEWR